MPTTKLTIGNKVVKGGLNLRNVIIDFPEPAQDGLVDLLIAVDNAELYYSRADVCGKVGGPVACLGPLGWTCISSPVGGQSTGTRTRISWTLFTRNLLLPLTESAVILTTL